MSTPAFYMQRALALAAYGRFLAHPNPMVGAVLVKNNKIIGEGWHQGPGTPHAEIHALNQAGFAQAIGSDLYVNLEPCSHYGRTGPCVEALVQAKIKRIFIPFTDPNPKVNGSGIQQLREAGIEVILGIEPEASEQLNRRFLVAQRQQRPYIIAKWAMTLDGQLTLSDPKQRWISSKVAREHAHQIRATVDAIAVGAQTWAMDRPQLSARPKTLENQTYKSPHRFVLSGRRRWTVEAFSHLDRPLTLVCPQEQPALAPLSHLRVWTLPDPIHTNGIDLEAWLQRLYQENYLSLIVEGGAETLQSFFAEQLVDECHTYLALSGSGWTDKPSLPFYAQQKNATLVETQSWDHDLFIRSYPHV